MLYSSRRTLQTSRRTNTELRAAYGRFGVAGREVEARSRGPLTIGAAVTGSNEVQLDRGREREACYMERRGE
jgi:hypothetical protein